MNSLFVSTKTCLSAYLSIPLLLPCAKLEPCRRMQSPQTSDALFEVRNLFYVGDFGQCISAATAIPDAMLSAEDVVEKEYLLSRSQIGLGQFDAVMNDPRMKGKSCPLAWQAVRNLALYLASPIESGARKGCIAQADEWGATPAAIGADASGALACCAIAAVFMHEGRWNNAMNVLHKVSSFEMSALFVECLLAVHRTDLAEKAVAKMKQIDEDHVLTQLSIALVSPHSKDAEMILEELLHRFPDSVMLLNAVALLNMNSSNFDEAEKLLLKALSKRNNDAETLINLYVCAQHLGKPAELLMRYMAQISAASSDHPWVKNLASFRSLLDCISGAV